MRLLIAVFTTVLVGLHGSIPATTVAQERFSKRPNVVMIMTDNHGAWTLGCYGNPDIRTPNIDRLANEGTLFTRAFASNPVCSPTRATSLTGLIPSQHGVHSFLAGGGLQTGPDAHSTLDEFTSLPQVLKSEGYQCGLVGKWHLGGNLTPQEGLDDYWITMPHGGTSTFYGAKVIEDGKIRTEPKYMTDLWTEHAVKFISEQSQSEDPFFLFLAYNGPYSLSRLLLRDGQNRHAEYYADKQLPSFPRQPTHPWQFNNRDFINNPTSIRRVATEVSGVDDGVGTVMSALKKAGIDDNTIVIFVADQGWVGGHGGFFGMGDHTRPLTARDGMMQIPLIWRHPNKIAAGSKSNQMFGNYDLMPTLLGHLGIGEKMPTAPKSPGTDFSLTLAGKGKEVSKPIFYEYENLRCIRTETMKYVHRHPNGPHELYDLQKDADEFDNLVDDPKWQNERNKLQSQLTSFFDTYAVPKYDMWNGGTSQVRIHDGIDEEMAQLASFQPPALTDGFSPAPIDVPEGYTAELVAGPPLVTHPTLGCFDDSGNLYVCNNAGVNLSDKELEEQLPNAIHRLSDTDGDGRFDRYTVFADKMTFPMGGAWHQGSLYVASPPNIWKLTDTDDDGVADERNVIVGEFGYNGNAASIHGCFFGADGRLYWCDGFHGHEFKDGDGNVTSQRQGSYIFSCLPDGSDVQILAGGGMDNPVEVDLTQSGDVLGTVNILYTRPRVDALVHWLHGGAYPHREKVLDELKTTGAVLGPVHRFGHVAISGMTRYRSGAMDHQFKDNLFATFFNHGKVVRLEMEPDGSTWDATQHEFLSSKSRDFHPTDVIEDADGSLLVVDTGGWFYRGCPTSQFAKPDLLGGIYRVRRTGMTPMIDPRGMRIDWAAKNEVEMTRLLNDTRFAVREKAIQECVRRGADFIPTLQRYLERGDRRIRRNCLWALTRLAQQPATAVAATKAITIALSDSSPQVRKLACRSLGQSKAKVDAKLLLPLLEEQDASVRREAATTLGKIGDASAVGDLIAAIGNVADRSEEHAMIYAMIEINEPSELYPLISAASAATNPGLSRVALIALDQMDAGLPNENDVVSLLDSNDTSLRSAAWNVVKRHPEWNQPAAALLTSWLGNDAKLIGREQVTRGLVARLAGETSVAEKIGSALSQSITEEVPALLLSSLASTSGVEEHESWIAPIRRRLLSEDEKQIEASMDVVAALKSKSFKSELNQIGDDVDQSARIRLRAMRAANSFAGPTNERMFALVAEILEDETNPSDAMTLARSLATYRLNDKQLIQLAEQLQSASPMQLRELIKVFGRTRKPNTIDVFLKAVGNAKSFLTLPESELSDVIKRYPKETLAQGNQLLDRLKQHRQAKQAKLSGLLTKLNLGDAKRGHIVFTSEKAKCSSCHRVGEQGKRIGPDLTTIGANRSPSDLLESIVLPSASIVRDYGTLTVLTDAGKIVIGLIHSETSKSVVIQRSTGELVTIDRDSIEVMKENAVSIMPNGLEEALSEQDLADVVAYLRSLK